jgi:hypothetical protein
MLGEQIKVREASEAEVHGLRLKPDNRNYAGPTFGAFLKSIQESNSCLKVSALGVTSRCGPRAPLHAQRPTAQRASSPAICAIVNSGGGIHEQITACCKEGVAQLYDGASRRRSHRFVSH